MTNPISDARPTFSAKPNSPIGDGGETKTGPTQKVNNFFQKAMGLLGGSKQKATQTGSLPTKQITPPLQRKVALQPPGSPLKRTPPKPLPRNRTSSNSTTTPTSSPTLRRAATPPQPPPRNRTSSNSTTTQTTSSPTPKRAAPSPPIKKIVLDPNAPTKPPRIFITPPLLPVGTKAAPKPAPRKNNRAGQ